MARDDTSRLPANKAVLVAAAAVASAKSFRLLRYDVVAAGGDDHHAEHCGIGHGQAGQLRSTCWLEVLPESERLVT
jgi:hypothetical protein